MGKDRQISLLSNSLLSLQLYLLLPGEFTGKILASLAAHREGSRRGLETRSWSNLKVNSCCGDPSLLPGRNHLPQSMGIVVFDLCGQKDKV